MKRIIAIVLCGFIITTLLTGCGSKEKSDVNSANSDEWKTVIFGETENSTIFQVDEKMTDKFDIRNQKKEKAKKEIAVDLWGTEYTGIYTETVTLPRSDTRVHVYDLENSERGSIIVDAKSNQILEYSLVPYDASKLKTEKDFMDVINAMVGDRVDLSEYDYKCTTHYYDIGENGIDSSVVDGFRTCTAENEKLGAYSFYYTKSVDGIKLPDHVSFDFDIDGNHLTLEIYEYGYDEEIFAPLLKNMDEIKASIEKHLTDNVKDECTIVDIKHGSCSLFVQDGIAYVMIRSTVEYASDYYKDKTFDIGIQTITSR